MLPLYIEYGTCLLSTATAGSSSRSGSARGETRPPAAVACVADQADADHGKDAGVLGAAHRASRLVRPSRRRAVDHIPAVALLVGPCHASPLVRLPGALPGHVALGRMGASRRIRKPLDALLHEAFGDASPSRARPRPAVFNGLSEDHRGAEPHCTALSSAMPEVSRLRDITIHARFRTWDSGLSWKSVHDNMTSRNERRIRTERRRP